MNAALCSVLNNVPAMFKNFIVCLRKYLGGNHDLVGCDNPTIKLSI